MNIGSDHEGTTFFDYLGVSLKDGGGDYEVVTLKGNCAGCSELLKYYYLGGVSPHYKVDRLQSGNATQLLASEEGHGRMFVYEHDGYKVITSSVSMGAIANGDSLNVKPYLVSEFVNYLLGYNPVTSFTENVTGAFGGRVFPNPFAGRTTISFRLAHQDDITVSIFDMNGRLVRTLTDRHYPAGDHSIIWDGTDDNGRSLPQGLYFCSIDSGNEIITKKLVLLPEQAE